MDAYEAWLVDLDGTLYRPMPVKMCMVGWLLMAEPSGIPTVRAFRKEHERLRAAKPREVNDAVQDPYSLQIERTAARMGRSPEGVRRCVERWMVERPARILRPFRREWLVSKIAEYKAGGGRTALVSDYPGRAKLRGLEAEELFDVVVCSGEPEGPRRLKPDPAGYCLAAERLGVSPDRCLVIGDRDDADGAAARAANMAFWRVT